MINAIARPSLPLTTISGIYDKEQSQGSEQMSLSDQLSCCASVMSCASQLIDRGSSLMPIHFLPLDVIYVIMEMAKPDLDTIRACSLASRGF